MNDIQSTTRWRDEPVIPSPADYEDIASLVKLARKARGRIVEFEWVFTREDLLSLRRAAYEWGSASVGVYRCRSARVLAAINDALGDAHSIYVLTEPKNAQGMKFAVSWTRDGDVFRLSGHARSISCSATAALRWLMTRAACVSRPPPGKPSPPR